MTTVDAPATAISPFPMAAVEACLRTELLEAIEAEATVRGVALPSDALRKGKVNFQIDSLVVVSILCAVDEIVGFELPEIVVRTGGYDSVNHALEQLLPAIKKQWIKHKGGKS